VGLGDRGFSPFQGGTNVFSYTNVFTMVKGSHSLNFGGSARMMQLNLLGDPALAGQFAFTRFCTAGFTPAGTQDGSTGHAGFNPASRRPYPQLQAVIAAISRGWMKYNSLQARLERRSSRGSYVLGSYTYAKALTNGVSGSGGDPGVVYFPVVTDDDVDVGSANTDLCHNFSLSSPP